jgi:hypothetical protein
MYISIQTYRTLAPVIVIVEFNNIRFPSACVHLYRTLASNKRESSNIYYTLVIDNVLAVW